MISNNSEIKNECLEDSSITNFKEDINSTKNFLDKKLRFASSHIESNQVIIMLGNQTCSRKSQEFLPLKILESYLSFGMSSVLFKLFREKNGITYDVGVLNSIREILFCVTCRFKQKCSSSI